MSIDEHRAMSQAFELVSSMRSAHIHMLLHLPQLGDQQAPRPGKNPAEESI